MNGYSIQADAYRKLASDPKTAQEEKDDLENKAKLLDFMGSIEKADRLFLFDTGAYNDVIKAYITGAAIRAGVDTTTRKAILNEVAALLNDKTAGEALEAWESR